MQDRAKNLPEGGGKPVKKRSRTLLRVRHLVEYWLLTTLAWVIPRLSRGVVLAVSRSIGNLAMRGDRRGRKLGLKNLRLAVERGGLDLGGRTAEEVLRACYQNFARGFLDLFWFSRLTAETLGDWVEIENEHHIRKLLRDDRGAIFLTPHFGNFEWSSLIVGFRGLKLDIVAQDFKNTRLTEVFRRAREHSGHRVLSRDGAMLKLLRAVKQGRNIAMLPDLNIPPQGLASVLQVFGSPAYMTSIHAEISSRCGVPMFVAVCEPLPDGRARLRVLDVISAEPSADTESRARTAQRVWDRFEAAIRERPELWLWMYRHWRYRVTEDLARADGTAASPASDTRPTRIAASSTEAVRRAV